MQLTMKRIDFHTHIFPDTLAARAIATLEAEADCKAFLNGTLADLRRSMRQTGIEAAVIASIATRPEHFESILQWSRTIRAEDIIPFLSVHPRDPDLIHHIRRVRTEGFMGIKMHPYYQDFDLDDPVMFPAYETMAENGLVLLCHTGFDIAFERIRRCDPMRIIHVLKAIPSLKLVTTHCGAWEDWDEVERHILGKPVYMDISYSKAELGEQRFQYFLNAHPSDYLIFGTDSPWANQQSAIRDVQTAVTDFKRQQALFYDNAARLLGFTENNPARP